MGGVKAAIMESLRQTPLGGGDNEGGLQAPFNAPKKYVRVKVRNISAVQERNHIIESVSWLRGGEDHYEQLAAAGKGGGVVSIDALHRMAAAGRDASIVEYGMAPIDVVLTFDNGQYLVPHTGDGKIGEAGEPAPWVEVPDGIYDLYVGNHDRLLDPRERAKELERVKSRRKDFVVRQGEKNKWAFLEFSYEVIEPIAVAVDSERIYNGEVVEV